MSYTRHALVLFAGGVMSCVAGNSQVIASLPAVADAGENQRAAELRNLWHGRVPHKPLTQAVRIKPQLIAFIGDNIFPQFVDGGGWSTAITVRNLDSKRLHFQILFLNDAGTDLVVPVVGLGQARGVDIALNVNGSVTFETQGLAPNVSAGWAYILKDDYEDVIGGFGVFRSRSYGRADFEAAVPIVSQFDSHFVLMYDNTAGYVTGMAVANPTGNSVTIPVTIYDEQGGVVFQQTVSLGAYSHVAFVLPQAWPSTAGGRGSIRVSHFRLRCWGIRPAI